MAQVGKECVIGGDILELRASMSQRLIMRDRSRRNNRRIGHFAAADAPSLPPETQAEMRWCCVMVSM